MTDEETETLQEELEHFRREREKIRNLIGRIGGKQSGRINTAINVVFILAIITLLAIDISRHVAGFSMPLPPLFSIELGVLLVSLKIIWMIHRQSKVEHFQFWILSSIEFRLNDIAKRLEKKGN